MAVLAAALKCLSFCLPVIILSQFLTVNMLPILELYYTCTIILYTLRENYSILTN